MSTQTLKIEAKTALELIKEACENPGELNKFYQTFYCFSINNQLLAASQLTLKGLGLTPLKTYSQWQECGRTVKKGEKALWLWLPLIYNLKKTEKDQYGNEKETTHQIMKGFALKNRWFSYEQTEGEEYKEPPCPLWNEEKALQTLDITLIPFSKLNGRIQGYTYNKKIAIHPMEKNRKSVLFHEMAHILLEHKATDPVLNPEEYSLQEVEAELTAYLCVHILNLKGKEYSRAYIQSYLNHTKFNNESAKRVLDCANKIIKSGEVKQKSLFDLAFAS